MRERPILFSGPMVRAMLSGSKTQTRRYVTDLTGIGRITEFGPSDTPGYHWHARDSRGCWNDMRDEVLRARCPFGEPRYHLWVRETWAQHPDHPDTQRVIYRADPGSEHDADRWRPSIHMPRWACRLVLEITSVRVERLQHISEADACAEGMGSPITRDCKVPKFAALWDESNGAGAWEANPWVWVIGFKRVEA